MSPAKVPRPRILRLPEVQQITGLSRPSVYRLERNGQFPKHLKLTQRASGWVEAEVLAWLEKRLAARAPAV